ncbi:MAG: hypothetical protein HC781_01640 [Leptolyngbyaceae cyanobacterium CSU_1_4]|nr:hypothetical protein [Leptolyngbyaceae cyanobacterium CSU_1_4]
MAEKQLVEIKEYTSLEEVAESWQVTTKTIKNWLEFIYKAFEIELPQSGNLPAWGVELLNIAGKHISPLAGQYYQETGERRRLKGAEFITKIQRLRGQGKFQEFQKFQKFQKPEPAAEEEVMLDDIEDDLLAGLAGAEREQDDLFLKMRRAIATKEEQQVEELADFIESSPQRKILMLRNKLQQRAALASVQSNNLSLGAVVEVAYSSEAIEV